MKLCLRTVAPVLVTLVALTAQARVTNVGSASATFDVAGPGGMNIHGKTPDLVASEDAGKVEVKVALDHLTTGIGLRDQHMRDKYLEVGKYPNATVVVPRKSLHLPSAGKSSSGKVSGQMTIHGVTQLVTLTYTAKAHGKRVDVDGSTAVDMREYGIDVPSYLGVGVDPHVAINVAFEVVDK